MNLIFTPKCNQRFVFFKNISHVCKQCNLILLISQCSVAAALQHQSFSLSLSNNAIEKASVGSYCITDYITVSKGNVINYTPIYEFDTLCIQIPLGTTTTIAAATAQVAAAQDRFCGRFLSILDADADQDTVCSKYIFNLCILLHTVRNLHFLSKNSTLIS